MSDDENKPELHAVPRTGYLQHLHRDNVMPRKQAEALQSAIEDRLGVVKSDSVPDGTIVLIGVDAIQIDKDWIIDWCKMANKTVLIKLGGENADDE